MPSWPVPESTILGDVFSGQSMAHWYDVFSGHHSTFGAVRGLEEEIHDPQLRANDVVVPLEGAGSHLQYTISSPMQVADVEKAPAKWAPDLGEHNVENLQELGFDPNQIESRLASGIVSEHAGVPRVGAASPSG